MSLDKQIKEKEERLHEITEELDDFIDQAEKEKRDLKEDEYSKIAELEKEHKSKKVEIKLLKDKEKRLIEKANVEQAEKEKKAAIMGGASGEVEQGEKREIEKASKRYSIARGIRILTGNEPNNGLESEMSQEARNESTSQGASYGYSGMAIPGKVFREEWIKSEKRTDIDQATSAIQPTDVGRYVEAIRQNAIFSQVIPAANILTGLTADFKIPAVGAQSLAWATAENSAAADGGNNYTKDTLAPVRLTGYADVSNRVILQNGEQAMQMVMADFGRETANEIDAALFSTADVTNAIPAIAATTGVLTFTEAATYAAPSATVNGTIYDDILAGLQALANGNAATGALAIVGNTKFLTDLLTSPRVVSVTPAVTGLMLGAPLRVDINGVPFYLTTSTTSSGTTSADFVGGNFNFEYLGFFGGLDITIDPYSVKLNDQQRIVVHRHVDSSAIRGAAFVKSTTLLS